MKKLLVISDWAGDHLAAQEMRTAVEGYISDPSSPNMQFIPSTSSTIHTAYLAAQLVHVEEQFGRPLETVIFLSTDPRSSTEQSSELPEGAQFIIVHLASGLYLCGPNSGYDFSMIKDKIEEVYEYTEVAAGPQSKPRELHARICAHLMDAMQDELDLEELSSNVIPALRGQYLGHIDSFGTLKTTIIEEDLKEKHNYEDEVTIKINSVIKKVRYIHKKFEGNPGELILFPGTAGPKDNPFIEIAVWQDFSENIHPNAFEQFERPRPGSKIEIVV